MVRSSIAVAAFAGACLALALPVRAQTVMQQCGQQYQAAKAAGTLNGMSWGQYRTDCAAKVKATPASAAAAPPPVETNPLKPAAPVAAPSPAAPPVVATGKASMPATGGRAAMLTRQKQCGQQWREQKVSLVAQTPGLTWPKYWSQCNKSLKAQ